MGNPPPCHDRSRRWVGMTGIYVLKQENVMEGAKMKRGLVWLVAAAVAASLFAGCAAAGCPPGTARTDAAYADDTTWPWHQDDISRLEQNDIEKSADDAKAVAEYRVLANFALLGYTYYAMQEHEDGTGRFTFIVYHGEDLRERMVSESAKMSEDDVAMLKKAICDNRFWDIPTRHPDEELGCDGWTVYVEGCEAGSRHFIHMWCPEKRHGIYRIFKAFDEYSANVAHNPLTEYQKPFE